MGVPPYEVWLESPFYLRVGRRFESWKTAERFARWYVTANDGKCVRIVQDHSTLAYVKADALGRVWTDVVDGSLSV